MAKKEEKKEMMTAKERAVCSTLCIFLAISVLSSVAMVYLTVIIYLPSQRELASGFNPEAVMCETIERQFIKDDIEQCRWNSCSEWCLSKGGAANCDHLFVKVRANGTNVALHGCKEVVDKTCSSLNLNMMKKQNCKKDNQCTRLDKLFTCEDGDCYNITSAYICDWDPRDTDAPVNCMKKRNCLDLTGTYDCNLGLCSRIKKKRCVKRCSDISTRSKNVVIMSGDRVIMAKCAEGTSGDERVWTGVEPDGDAHRILMTSCINVVKDGGVIRAEDCVNGSLVPAGVFSPESNYTELNRVFHEEGQRHKLYTKGNIFPFEDAIMIFNRSRLMINHEGCVNTLQFECRDFYNNYGNDGSNYTARSRFPCFFSVNDGLFVVKRFDLEKTRWVFFLFFVVPASLLFTSCSVLFLCSRILRIDQTGHMAMVCCQKEEEEEETDKLHG